MKKLSWYGCALALLAVVAGLAGCGGNSTTNVAVGGKITGLTTDTVQLYDGFTAVTLGPSNNNTNFTFPTRVAVGAAYSILILKQPVGLTCHVENPSGITTTSDVTNTNLTCVSNNS